MRTREEQMVGLEVVAELATRERINVMLDSRVGDVATLVAKHTGPGPTEVVFASGGYDLWRGGRLDEANVSAEAAAQALVDDYRTMKAQHMAKLHGMTVQYARAWLDAGEPAGEAGRRWGVAHQHLNTGRR